MLHPGDALEVLARVPDESVDCVWTDLRTTFPMAVSPVSRAAWSVSTRGDRDRSRRIEANHEFNLAWKAVCRRMLKPAGTAWVSGTLHVYLSVGTALVEPEFPGAGSKVAREM